MYGKIINCSIILILLWWIYTLCSDEYTKYKKEEAGVDKIEASGLDTMNYKIVYNADTKKWAVKLVRNGVPVDRYAWVFTLSKRTSADWSFEPWNQFDTRDEAVRHEATHRYYTLQETKTNNFK